MRTACPDCGQTVGHYETCPQGVPPSRRVSDGNPLVMDALLTSDRHMTWTA